MVQYICRSYDSVTFNQTNCQPIGPKPAEESRLLDARQTNRRYERFWSKAKRLVDAFLKQQLAAVKAGEPMAPMREIYVAVQCLKRMYEGRNDVSTGGEDAVECQYPSETDRQAAEEVSRRLRALLEMDEEDGDDEESV